MTGYSSTIEPNRFIEETGAPLLKKPYSIESLGHKVRETLDATQVGEVIYA
jgi:hypothetical protein